MNLKQAQKRIEELERRVKELEAAPKQEIHYHNYPPAYTQPYFPAPQPYDPWKWVPPMPVICGSEPTYLT